MARSLFLKIGGAAFALALSCVGSAAAEQGPSAEARTIAAEVVAAEDVAAAKSGFTRLASHILYERNFDGNATSATCYFTNVGKKFVRIKDIRLMEQSGAKVTPTSNSCGNPKGAKLAPNRSCFVGAPRQFGSGILCSALVDDRAAVRGSLEQRDASAKVLTSTELTVGTGGTSGGEFETMASPAMFGAPSQRRATCTITNFGSKIAQYRKPKIVRFDGTTLPTEDDCQGFIAPTETCRFSAFDIGVNDVHCRLEVKWKADLRGVLLLQDLDYNFLNSQPMR